jgi:hypothetical protein
MSDGKFRTITIPQGEITNSEYYDKVFEEQYTAGWKFIHAFERILVFESMNQEKKKSTRSVKQ